MKRKFIYLLLISLSLPVLLWASDANKKEGRINNAETLVASKQESDLSYKQIMELMGKGSALIHAGILRENSIMVEQGSQLIDGHYAPYHKPWDMFEGKEDQEAFKQMLLIYDRILHDASHTIETLAK